MLKENTFQETLQAARMEKTQRLFTILGEAQPVGPYPSGHIPVAGVVGRGEYRASELYFHHMDFTVLVIRPLAPREGKR